MPRMSFDVCLKTDVFCTPPEPRVNWAPPLLLRCSSGRALVLPPGTQTVHQMLDIDINAAPPGGGPAGRPLAATQNRRISMLMWDGSSSGNYHSMQVAITV